MNPAHTPILIAALILGAQTATALSIEPDSSPGSPERVRQAIEILPRVGTDETPVMPTVPATSTPVQPGLTGGQDWLKILHDTLNESIAPSTLAQGAYILDRPGSIVPGPNGYLIFVPDQATKLAGEGPVLLMPCQTLERLENQWTNQQVELSGEIFTYHNRNQLLIADYRILPAQPDASTAQATTPAPDEKSSPNPADPASAKDDPGVRDLLNELEFDTQSSGSTRQENHDQINDSTNALNQRSQVTISESIPGYDEGTLILRQPSRMIRNSSGAWVIVFDNDTSDAKTSPELIVEPCKLLMHMEHIAMEAGDTNQLLVSGRIYTYKGLHYILPTLIQRVPAQELSTLQ